MIILDNWSKKLCGEFLEGSNLGTIKEVDLLYDDKMCIVILQYTVLVMNIEYTLKYYF